MRKITAALSLMISASAAVFFFSTPALAADFASTSTPYGDANAWFLSTDGRANWTGWQMFFRPTTSTFQSIQVRDVTVRFSTNDTATIGLSVNDTSVDPLVVTSYVVVTSTAGEPDGYRSYTFDFTTTTGQYVESDQLNFSFFPTVAVNQRYDPTGELSVGLRTAGTSTQYVTQPFYQFYQSSTSGTSVSLDEDSNGVPWMIINASGNGSSIVDYPDPNLYGLSATSSATQQDFGLFGNFFRDVLLFLFKPPSNVTQQYNDQVASLRLKVPWGWWAQVSAGFEAVSSTQAATTTALTMQVPHQGVTTTVAIFDVAAASALIPSGVSSLIRTIGGVAIWALFGTWIWVLVTGNKSSEDDL